VRLVNLETKPKQYHKWYSVVRKDIVRYDYRHKKRTKKGSIYYTWTHGWCVRINWHGKQYRKMFYDHHSSGPIESLHRAKMWRFHKYNEIGKPYTDKVLQPGKQNGLGTGLRRVRNYKVQIPRGDKLYKYNRDVICVTWPIGNGKHGATTVSVDTYGFDEALKRAKKILSNKYKEFYGVKVL